MSRHTAANGASAPATSAALAARRRRVSSRMPSRTYRTANSRKAPAGDQKHESDRHDVDDEQPEVDARGRLAERRENQGVDGVDARHLEVVRLRVRRNPPEQQLAEVRVLALVAVERDVEQSQSD